VQLYKGSSAMNANYTPATNSINDGSQIQPQFRLRFERSASHSARGRCLVDVLLKNNGTIAASFPFFCLTNLARGETVELARGQSRKALGANRPMLKDLLRGRISKFDLEKLTALAWRAGLTVKMSVRKKAAKRAA